MCSSCDQEQNGQFIKTLTSFLFLLFLLFSPFFVSPSYFHCGRYQISIWTSVFHLQKNTHQGKVLVSLKFLSKKMQNCVIWAFQIFNLGFFKKFGFFGFLVLIGNHIELKYFFPLLILSFIGFGALTLKLDFQVLIAINPIMLYCGSCRFE